MFAIFERKRKRVEIVPPAPGAFFTFERRELPNAGANQYALETFGLPVTTISNGNILVENPYKATFPSSYAVQAVGVVGIPPSGILQGQFTTQPLMNPNQAESIGVVSPNVIPPGAYNVLPTGAPVIAP